MRFSSCVISSALVFAATVAGPSVARAQNAPAGAIWDLNTVSPGLGSTYTQFSTSFVADITGTEYVSFAFRQAPSYFAFDDVQVYLSTASSTNLFTDADFEGSSGVVGSNFPAGWSRWIQPIDTSAIGEVASNGAPYGCGTVLPNPAHGGSIFWCDGSGQGYDGIYQGISTTNGLTYDISFWLADRSGPTSVPSIDTLVYAGDNIPVGTVTIGGTPEPLTFALVGLGLAVLGFRRRR